MGKIFGFLTVCAQRLFLEPLTVARDLAWRPLRQGNARFLADRAQIRNMRRNKSNPPAIFVWIPKAAGTSVAAALEQRGAQTLLSVEAIKKFFRNRGVVTFGHIYLPALVQAGLVSEEFMAKAVKFAIVRNPYDRLISLFEYLKRLRYLPKTSTFNIFCHYLQVRAFEKVGLSNHDGLSQLNSQVTWLIDSSGTLTIDKIYRYEQLSSSWPELWANIGFQGEAPILPKLNTSEARRKPEDYFSANTVKVVQEAYHDDFEILGYSTEPYWLARSRSHVREESFQSAATKPR
jgi:hypothetical protein